MTIANQPGIYDGCSQFESVEVGISINEKFKAIGINLEPKVGDVIVKVSHMVLHNVKHDMEKALDIVNISFPKQLKSAIKQTRKEGNLILDIDSSKNQELAAA